MMQIYKKYKFNKSNFLKYIEQVYRAILIEDKKSERYDLDTINKIIDQKKLIIEIGEFTKSFEWLKQEKTIERAKVFTKSKFDYGLMCKQLGIGYDAAKTSISYINGELKKKIGSSTLELILEGKVEEAKLIFYFNSGKLSVSDYIIDSAISNIPDSNYMTINITDCQNELRYLYNYSRVQHNKWLNAIDKEKMGHLRYILETDNPKFSEEKKELVRLLRGEIKIKNYMEELKEREIF